MNTKIPAVDFTVIIPARYESTRLPGKPLLSIRDHPMIHHVYRRALESGAKHVWVATDDARIQKSIESIGGAVIMTGQHHHSGTERIAEAIEQIELLDTDILVNLQGDEPFMPSALIQQAANALNHTQSEVATLCTRITDSTEMFNPNVVKVVRDHQDYALYFSRAPIPWIRDEFTKPSITQPKNSYRHIGLYAYRAKFIRNYPALSPSSLEQLECLEQLRILYHGHRIYVEETNEIPGIGIDTPEDLKRINDTNFLF